MTKSNGAKIQAGEDVFLTPRQAAAMLELTEGTLAAWRHSCTHPLQFTRLNHQLVRYALADVQRYLSAHTVRPRKSSGRRPS